MRTFIAIDLPEEILQKITKIKDYFQSQIPDGTLKWVQTENLHLTIKFISEIPEKRLIEVKTAITNALRNQQAFNITIEGLGMYPNARNPRVIWLGILHDDVLKKIHQTLEEALQTADIPPEARAFSPHLTLARLRKGIEKEKARKIGEYLSQFKVDSLGTIHIQEICLYQSKLTPSGPIYTPLLKVPLNQV